MRIRTFKKVGTVTYYSTWSEGVNTAIKQTIKSEKTITLSPGEKESYTFNTNNKMVFVVSLKATAEYSISKGGIRIILENEGGKIIQNDLASLKGYETDDYNTWWFYNDDFFVPSEAGYYKGI